jgi:hypothetical protein
MLKRFIVSSIVIVSACNLIWAQEIDISDTDSIDERWLHHIDWTDMGINAQIGRQQSNTPAGRQMGAWVSAGLDIKKYQIGVFMATYEETYQQTIIFPNEFVMNYLYGGYYAGYTWIQNRWFQSSVTFAYGKGDLIWERSTTFENYFRDTFSMTQAFIDIETTPIRFIRPILLVGYRKMSRIDMPLLHQNDFNGLTIAFGIRFGFYTKQSFQ